MRMRSTDQADLREREAEGLREQWQQDIGDIRQAVVKSMRCATRSKRAPGSVGGQSESS